MRQSYVTHHRGQRIHCVCAHDDGHPSPKRETVVLLHGLFSNANRWSENGFVAPLVAKGYRVIAIDSLGHGESDKPHDPALYTLEQRVGDVLTVCDALLDERSEELWGSSPKALDRPSFGASSSSSGRSPAPLPKRTPPRVCTSWATRWVRGSRPESRPITPNAWPRS